MFYFLGILVSAHQKVTTTESATNVEPIPIKANITAIPSALDELPSIVPIKTRNITKCEDDIHYVGPFNERCGQWLGNNCLSKYWRLRPGEKRELIKKCPKSCSLCGPEMVVFKPLYPLIVHPKKCYNIKKYFDWCRDRTRRGQHCILLKNKLDRKLTITRCREMCGLCIKDFTKQKQPSQCLFPFKIKNKWYHDCLDTINMDPGTFQYIPMEHGIDRPEETAWCPLELNDNQSFEKDGYYKRCFLKDNDWRSKRLLYHRCEFDYECDSNVCEYYHDGFKRCCINSGTLCHAKDGPGQCRRHEFCNPYGYHHHSDLQKDLSNAFETEGRRRYKAEEFFYLSDVSRSKTITEIRAEVRKKYPGVWNNLFGNSHRRACICGSQRMQPFLPARGSRRTCLGPTAIAVCKKHQFCNQYSLYKEKLCVNLVTDIEGHPFFRPTLFDKVTKMSDIIIATILTVCCLIAVMISGILLTQKNNDKKKKKIKLIKEKEKFKEYRQYEYIGKLLDETKKDSKRKLKKKKNLKLRTIPENKMIAHDNSTLCSYSTKSRDDNYYIECNELSNSSDDNDECIHPTRRSI